MKKYWKILLSLAGGMLAYLSIYSIWKRPAKMIPLVYVKAEKVALLPKDKEICGEKKGESKSKMGEKGIGFISNRNGIGVVKLV